MDFTYAELAQLNKMIGITLMSGKAAETKLADKEKNKKTCG